MRHTTTASRLATALLLAVLPIGATDSESFRITDSTFNSGGHTDPDGVLSSTSFRITLDAIGDGVAGHRSLASVSFHADGGFVDVYAPPPEVGDVRWADRSTLVWGPTKSSGTYGVYVGSLEALRQSAPDDCIVAKVAGTQTHLPANPIAGNAWFHLVTALNHVGEEGTRGSGSDGIARAPGTPCP